jgi:cytochrome c peroxidase
VGGTGDTYDTPSLLSLYAATSYLHDGRAKDLQEVLTIHNANDRHGRTSHLNAQEIQDLVAFLLALPTTDRRMPLK